MQAGQIQPIRPIANLELKYAAAIMGVKPCATLLSGSCPRADTKSRLSHLLIFRPFGERYFADHAE
jgi:hypothetical protein